MEHLKTHKVWVEFAIITMDKVIFILIQVCVKTGG